MKKIVLLFVCSVVLLSAGTLQLTGDKAEKIKNPFFEVFDEPMSKVNLVINGSLELNVTSNINEFNTYGINKYKHDGLNKVSNANITNVMKELLNARRVSVVKSGKRVNLTLNKSEMHIDYHDSDQTLPMLNDIYLTLNYSINGVNEVIKLKSSGVNRGPYQRYLLKQDLRFGSVKSKKIALIEEALFRIIKNNEDLN